jgi:hypothetical protein
LLIASTVDAGRSWRVRRGGEEEVRLWHLADLGLEAGHVRFRGQSRHQFVSRPVSIAERPCRRLERGAFSSYQSSPPCNAVAIASAASSCSVQLAHQQQSAHERRQARGLGLVRRDAFPSSSERRLRQSVDNDGAKGRFFAHLARRQGGGARSLQHATRVSETCESSSMSRTTELGLGALRISRAGRTCPWGYRPATIRRSDPRCWIGSQAS